MDREVAYLKLQVAYLVEKTIKISCLACNVGNYETRSQPKGGYLKAKRPEVRIYESKQEREKTRFRPRSYQEKKERKKIRSRPRKRSRKKEKTIKVKKKERKHTLDQESDQNKKEKTFSFFLGRERVFFFFLTFLFSFINSQLSKKNPLN